MSEPLLIGGRYELGELLGRGGMAEVRKGTDTRLGRVVAVKRLRTDLASDATFQARFRREAQSAASLNHPSIVAVYDTGEEPATDGSGVDQPYIVMEYVAGRTLRDVLREGRKILPERALEITSGVLAALDYSHRAGIIHRDIKPGNVMLTPGGDVKVMDFGIARAVSDASSTMTQTAAVVGTAQYLSPEQARGETVDSRSDVYSAGCLLYELLAGRPPFVGDSPVAVAYQHVREQARPPSDFDEEIPPELDAIVMKSLAKRVEDRYQSAAAMRTDIERYLAGAPVHAGPPAVPVPTTTTVAAARPTPTPAPTPLPEADEDDRPPVGALVLLGLLVIALVVAGVLLWPRLFPSSPDDVQVPDVVGKNEAAARQTLGDSGFEVNPNSVFENSDKPAGRVLDQDPSGDSFVTPGTQVTLTISAGKAEKEVPRVVDQQLDVAKETLKAAGFKVTVSRTDSQEPRNQVLSQNPESGTQAQEGTPINLTVSRGPTEVPDVTGMKQAEAQKVLSDAGFNVLISKDTDSSKAKGVVLRQSPTGGTPLEQGQDVNIVVNDYEKPTKSPSPTDSSSPSDSASPSDGSSPSLPGSSPSSSTSPSP
ncbi:Stk1 family PASTA domain-containing Ser/Thr kinase [Nocardioides acrostichi]|uniref:non-specific serine/threonine protein kinase n=1 Tax=Nocardioides acrostichi TaxID=2784339 RepID=A0A930V4R4_9ACTN|nr:Stk1 family PASTA domain-containing Ser/Thr kinase [Nocardioides acrostichi]MBF4163964.1 Stk1 family PASTA domain-containing Ser/Thr kinase [Nocardioides acrostichi]